MSKIDEILGLAFDFIEFPKKQTKYSRKRWVRMTGAILNPLFIIPGLWIFSVAVLILTPINELIKAWKG